MPAALAISPELSLPIDAVTETFGILAKKGAGKSNAAVVMAEEMWSAGVPWVAIDPKGDWWGVRASADGKSPGLALPVFGGEQGDVPLEPGAGALLADLVAEERLTSVFDVSEFSKADQRRFLLAFAERLLRRNREPLHLFLEEAHEYLPQRVMRDEAQLVGAWSKIVKQGRFRGLGATLVSQRSASLNKDVLTQVDTLVVMRTTAPQDRKAVMAWVEEHDFAHDLVASLPELADGEAWVWSPEFLKTTERIRFRRRHTFDSGATPKMGQHRRAPATLADVDLAAIKEQMAETIERAKGEDPKELRRRIAQLERELEAAAADRPEPVIERVEVPVLDRQLVEDLEELLQPATGALAEVQETLFRHRRWMEEQPAPAPPQSLGRRTGTQTPPAPQPPTGEVPRRAADRGTVEGLGPGATGLLETLARRHPMRLSRQQLATMAGRSIRSSSFTAQVAELKKLGLAEEVDGQLTATPAGLDHVGEAAARPQTSAELVEVWRQALPDGPRRMLDVLLDAYPSPMARDELAAAAGFSPTSSSVGAHLTTLRRNGLIDTDAGGARATDTLFA